MRLTPAQGLLEIAACMFLSAYMHAALAGCNQGILLSHVRRMCSPVQDCGETMDRATQGPNDLVCGVCRCQHGHGWIIAMDARGVSPGQVNQQHEPFTKTVQQ